MLINFCVVHQSGEIVHNACYVHNSEAFDTTQVTSLSLATFASLVPRKDAKASDPRPMCTLTLGIQKLVFLNLGSYLLVGQVRSTGDFVSVQL